MSSKLLLLTIVLACTGMLTTGCAQIGEGLSALGKPTPENAPPGYHSFESAKQHEQANDLSAAAFNYCNAAELGHPQAKQKCIETAFRAAGAGEDLTVCYAENVDRKAKEVCNIKNQKRRVAAIRAVLEDMDKQNIKRRIQNGEFPDFKMEEF